jgi:hypothetical protein
MLVQPGDRSCRRLVHGQARCPGCLLSGSSRSIPRPVRRQAADFDQFQAERLDLGEHTVKRGLVSQDAGQDCVATSRPGSKRWKRGAQRLTQTAANTDLIALRRRTMADTGHALTTH